MARAINFPYSNTLLKGLESENVYDAMTYSTKRTCTTCWELTPEELKEIAETGKVYMTQLCGGTLVPTFIGSEASVEVFLGENDTLWDKPEPEADMRERCHVCKLPYDGLIETANIGEEMKLCDRCFLAGPKG